MSRRAWFLAALLAFALAWFGGLDYRKLVKPDEGRYAEIAREMAIAGDWVTPRLNGIKYFEKPPLQYWATAAAFKAFGPDEWTARLWPALTGFLGVLLAFYAGRRLFGDAAGTLAAAVLGSSLLYVMIGHYNVLDMGLAFFLQLAVTGFLLAQGGRRAWMWLAWAALALAVLSKGIVALVLTGATLVLYSLLTRDLSPWRRLEWGAGPAIFLAIAAPWFVAVSLANPEFPRFFFIHEHFERFLTTSHRRGQPIWYFVPVLVGGALPWTGMALQALATAWRRPAAAGGFRPAVFLLAWCAVVFGFFSASGSKLPSYILPLFPALALLTGAWLAEASRRAMLVHVGLVGLVATTAMLLTVKVAGLGDQDTPSTMMAAYAAWLAAAAGLWLGATLSAAWLVWRGRALAAMLVLAAGGLLAGLGMLLGHESLARSNSAAHMAAEVKPLLAPGVPFYSVGTYDQTLPFYLGRTLTLVDYRDEMGFGLDQEPALAVASVDEFRVRWLADADAFALLQPEAYEAMAASLPMAVVARDTRRVIVRKPQ